MGNLEIIKGMGKSQSMRIKCEGRGRGWEGEIEGPEIRAKRWGDCLVVIGEGVIQEEKAVLQENALPVGTNSS